MAPSGENVEIWNSGNQDRRVGVHVATRVRASICVRRGTERNTGLETRATGECEAMPT